MSASGKRHPFRTLAVPDAAQLRMGRAPRPVQCGFALTIGGGTVVPELNFTLPTMVVEPSTWQTVREHYREIGEMIGRAARRLQLPGLLVEFELLPPMTEYPPWGADITDILLKALRAAHERHGLPCALRVTPTDIRDLDRPPQMRAGRHWSALRESLEQCARAGGHVLSIESVGGKEVNDEAMLYGDVGGVIFALGVLAPRDMEFLWKEITAIAGANGVLAGADTACGFANTAMQLASQGMLPEVFAAVVRAAAAVRSLVAFECGAVGPSKDCAYEGPIMKAIAGVPISMEGKSAACAHFSPVGNIAAAMCDAWSNESVQNVRLLSGTAPEAFLELLAYDCRLFNEAIRSGRDAQLQQLLVESDTPLSPQALVLTPEATMAIAQNIVAEENDYRRTLAAARTAVRILTDGLEGKRTAIGEKEQRWLRHIADDLERLPSDEQILIGMMTEKYGHLFTPESYAL